jgi:hypothetical protein
MEMRGAAFLGFDGAEVLDVPAHAAAGVLPEAIEQCWEVDGVSGCSPVVVVVWIEWCSIGVDASIGLEGEGEEGRRLVATGEHSSHRSFLDGSAGEVWGVLAAAGGPLEGLGWWIKGGEPATDPSDAQFSVEFGD